MYEAIAIKSRSAYSLAKLGVTAMPAGRFESLWQVRNRESFALSFNVFDIVNFLLR
jgi:hypothetical protein